MFSYLPKWLVNEEILISFYPITKVTIDLLHWFVYTAHSRPKSAQTSAATAKVKSRTTQKLLIHRGNGAMSLSVTLYFLLFRVKKHFC